MADAVELDTSACFALLQNETTADIAEANLLERAPGWKHRGGAAVCIPAVLRRLPR